MSTKRPTEELIKVADIHEVSFCTSKIYNNLLEYHIDSAVYDLSRWRPCCQYCTSSDMPLNIHQTLLHIVQVFCWVFSIFQSEKFLLSSRVWSVAFLGCVAYHVQERRVCGERESYILRTRHIKCWLLYKHCHIAALCNNFSSSRSPWYQWFSLTLLKCFVRFW